ncbi:Protein YicC [hydrothermal vent metagenome]|uniref:Protein YicC n=1 Tax=hydrothermal vent metagenome TaxID=652676 RepID=A0A3B1BPL2_9ZZZZ
MVRSMTAFSRQEASGAFGSLVLELRSVNQRFLDINFRLPEELRSLEPRLRAAVSERLSRGKVEFNLRYQPPQVGQDELTLDMDLVRRISDASREVDRILYDHAPVNSLEILRWPGVLQTRSVDQDILFTAVSVLLDTALDDLIATREREGEKLASVIEQRCAAMATIVEQLRANMPEILTAWREKLNARLKQAGIETDAERLEQEIVLLANKTDVDEELDRLSIHIEEVRRVLKDDQPIGRRLDFLMQELNREVNTLGSKSVHVDSTRASVDMKVLIEQMREQVQNIE